MHVLALVLYTVLIAKKLINAFLAEVDRDRTPWDKFADLVIGLAHIGGEVAKELEPACKLINSIAHLLVGPRSATLRATGCQTRRPCGSARGWSAHAAG
jgi:hypothetical protein